MKLEILRTYVTLKANNHNVKPYNMTIGGFSIVLDDIDISYDNYDFYGGWADGYEGPNTNCEEIPIIEWECRGGSEIFQINGKTIASGEDYQFDIFEDIPAISAITDIYYEAFTNLDEGVEYEFYPIEFAIKVIDRDTNKEYVIEASTEVLQAYINNQIDEGLLKEI